MARRVNRVLPPNKRLSLMFLDLSTITSEHKRLFPGSRLMKAYWVSLIFLFLLMLGVMCSIVILSAEALLELQGSTFRPFADGSNETARRGSTKLTPHYM